MALHPDVIRSRTNPALKRVGAVVAGKERGLLLLEGARLVGDARAAGLEFELLLLAEDDPGGREWAERLGERTEVRLVEQELLERVSALEKSPGILALVRAPARRELRDLEGTFAGGDRALVLVVAGVSDPGNLGALARSAEAAGATAMVLIAGTVSPWNSKALRGSMGSLLRLPILHAESAEEAAAEFVLRNMRQAIAATRGGKGLREFDWSGALALWVTGETGVAPAVSTRLEPITIAMAGEAESLNVTVAGSLLLFAAGRAEKQA
ncbi:MAG: TrmH family RNA methyltransferase [Planctomycetota bacterium]